MSRLRVECPASLDEALDGYRRARQAGREVRWLAGGQTLLAAMKHGLSQPDLLIDLGDVAELRVLHRTGQGGPADRLEVGAMVTHAQMAADPLVRAFAPGLAAMATRIADPQVRQMGTVGGSLANHDPAACWPAAMLALDAQMLTTGSRHSADDFFTGLYATALQEEALLTAIHVPRPDHFAYLKIEQPASRFALAGVALARFGPRVRVAVTGMGQGAQRWPQAEQALQADWGLHSVQALRWDESLATSDLHAGADYRAHLASVLLHRLVSAGGPANPAHASDPSNPSRLVHPSSPRRPGVFGRFVQRFKNRKSR